MLDTISALLLLLIIPGPTNTLLFRAGMMFGFSSSRRLAFIESIAYMIQVSLWGAALLYVSAYNPWAIKIIQVCAAGYLFYTSYKLWKNKNSTFGEKQDQFSGQYFFLLTLMNPKGLLIVHLLHTTVRSLNWEITYNLWQRFCLCLLRWDLRGYILELDSKALNSHNVRP